MIKENKKIKKKDGFWKLIFPLKKYNHSNKSEEVLLSVDKQTKLKSLSTYASHHFSITLNADIFQTILENNDWDTKKAVTELTDYEEASHGILIEPPPHTIKLLGAENDRGSSCYIDSLLFAMYISNTTFDPLLTYEIPSEFNAKSKLQTLMRLYVNKLRKGHFIHAEYTNWLRRVLEELDWHGRDSRGNWTQEDVSELFMFLTEIFDLPYLPFQIRLFHGANHDADDDRLMTDRALTLSIPEIEGDEDGNLRLENILVDYFYNNVITGIRRQIDCEFECETLFSDHLPSPRSNMSFSFDTKIHLMEIDPTGHKRDNDQVAVTAWQVLELLPFYTASNEQGDSISSQVDSSFPDTRMVLPIVLKRYKYDNTGGSTKIKRHVDVPTSIDFNKFVNQNSDDPVCPSCGEMINWTLYLKSAVCHEGDSPMSGHYIAYARVDEGESKSWLKCDDLNKDQRVMPIKESKSAQVYSDMGENAYMLFYELDKTCHHGNGSHYVPLEVMETKVDAISSNLSLVNDLGKGETDKRNNHQHTHNRIHLKESCSLM
ncbi:ubiquitin carboxyl-terminal hydrolase-domain-containing protein [Pilobolus umbonatus]|nr:ubiquitin carboxyl-terminal hydrolase-domain-containing protein [Pilobolus umbonatus]